MDGYVRNPFTRAAFVVLTLILIFLIPFLLFSLVGATFTKLGFSWREAIIILALTLMGSFINIPLKTLKNTEFRTEELPVYPMYGRIYRIVRDSPTTTIAVNIGGAVVPVTISLYLLSKGLSASGGIFFAAFVIGISAVTLITHMVAHPVPGLGIATPFFIPPLSALVAGLTLSVALGVNPSMIAYTSGTIGTLIGADILNLSRIGDLGAPVVSIGGAGTFDGIFLAGIIAAFLA
jgi:uncharacterized membrane protein